MTLRLALSTVAGGFYKAITEGERPIAKAATAAVRDATEMAKSAGRASIAGAGFSRKWQNALRVKIYPPNRDSMRAAALIYHKVPYAEVFEEGVVIQGKPLLWLPLPSAPFGAGGRRIPASKFQQKVGSPLYTIRRAGKPPMLGAHVRTTNARAGKAISLALLRRGGNPGGRGSVRLVPLYVGIEVASIPKRFAILDAISRAAARLPDLYLKHFQD
jgi:Family of unknown function (DUF6441)